MNNKLAIISAMLFTASTALTSMGKVTLDVSLVGEIGSSELAAFAFVFPILFLLISVAGGIYVATAAAFAGAGRLDNGRVRRGPLLQSVLVSLILGALVAAVLHACLPGLLTAMGAANHLAQLGRYFSIWLWTVPLMFVSANTFAIIRNLGYFKTASAITLAATAVGAYLSILLIPVHMGGAIWGVAGSAYSTLATSALSTMLSLAFVVVLSCKGGESAFWSAFVEMAQSILIIGLPVLLSNILLFLFLSMLTRVFSGFGQDSIAAYGINGRVEQILLYFQTAFVTVATPTITRLWTKHDSASMLVFIRGMASLMFWFSLVGAVIVFVARHWIAAMASPTPETYKICVFFLCVVPGTIGLQGIFILATTTLNLMKKPGRSLLWCGIYYGVINAPLLLASQPLGDARWSISALALATIVAGALSWLLISREIKAATGVMDHLIMPMSNESAKL
jgi:Na+-driven multidrug efflux pump